MANTCPHLKKVPLTEEEKEDFRDAYFGRVPIKCHFRCKIRKDSNGDLKSPTAQEKHYSIVDYKHCRYYREKHDIDPYTG